MRAPQPGISGDAAKPLNPPPGLSLAAHMVMDGLKIHERMAHFFIDVYTRGRILSVMRLTVVSETSTP